MFYSQIILSKKGPLGKIWQAAHWGDKKLGRPAIFATDISSTVDELLHPVAPMALRVSGHLLLGVVRIYSRQVQYLADDCHAAVLKVQLAYSTNKASTTTTTTGTKETITTTTTTATTTNVSHFGEYTDVEFAVPISQFQIPFDISDETSPEDWIPVAAYFEEEGESPITTTATTTLAMEQQPPRLADEEEWGEFDPSDGEEEEEGKENQPTTTKPSTSTTGKEEESTVSSVEQPRAAALDESTTHTVRDAFLSMHRSCA
jgi:cohesin complex subunit SCC1